MIRNIVILTRAGDPLFQQHFGECHSFGNNPSVITEFRSAIFLLAQQQGKAIRHIDVGGEKMSFYQNNHLIYSLVTDLHDSDIEIMKKIEKIAGLFESAYIPIALDYRGDPDLFKPFLKDIMEAKLVVKNCGGHEVCSDCPNHTKILPLEKYSKKMKKSRLPHEIPMPEMHE